jgi:uncharacterized protein (TIGR02453 family)
MSPFTPKTLSFLRALERNNDREWFRERKGDYERHVRGPMVELIARLARDFRSFAPDLIAEPKVSLYRIYRDTRFGSDKSPLKTHVAARFPARGLGRTDGAGLYLEVAPGWVWMGGGMYMPSSTDLRLIRAHIAATHPRLQRIATGRAFSTAMGELQGERLSRVPRGFPADHPAAHYLQFRQFLAGCEYDAGFATSRSFYAEVLKVFRATAPLVRFLNAPLLAQRGGATLPEPDAAAAPRPRTRRGAAHPPVPEPMW